MTCNVYGHRLEIDMMGGNQRDYYAQFWTTYKVGNSAWTAWTSRGGLWLQDDQTLYRTGPDVIISAANATYAVWVRVTYPNGAVAFDGQVTVSYYPGIYGTSQSANYGGVCQM